MILANNSLDICRDVHYLSSLYDMPLGDVLRLIKRVDKDQGIVKYKRYIIIESDKVDIQLMLKKHNKLNMTICEKLNIPIILISLARHCTIYYRDMVIRSATFDDVLNV